MNAVAGIPVIYKPDETRRVAYVKGWWKPKIVLGAAWQVLPKDVQAAVIAHELGHVAHGHAWQRFRNLLRGFRSALRICRQQEIEADEYAAHHGHGPGLIRLYAVSNKRRSRHALIQRIHLLSQPAYRYRIRRIRAAKGEFHGCL